MRDPVHRGPPPGLDTQTDGFWSPCEGIQQQWYQQHQVWQPLAASGLQQPAGTWQHSNWHRYNYSVQGTTGFAFADAVVNADPFTVHRDFRKHVMSLRRAHKSLDSAPAVRGLLHTLSIADKGNTPIEGGLLGMAAAQAARLGLAELVRGLCSYSYCRLPLLFGGREVAELAAAASKLAPEADRFFEAVGAYCAEHAEVFLSLRDLVLVATALVRHWLTPARPAPGCLGFKSAGGQDAVVASFNSIAMAALVQLKNCSSGNAKGDSRDVAEILHVFVRVLASVAPVLDDSGPCTLTNFEQVVSEATTASTRLLHMASAQDIAKIAGAVAETWSLLPRLRATVLVPCLQHITHAVGLRYNELNSLDIASIAVALAKLEASDETPTVDEATMSVLARQVTTFVHEFGNKEFSLLLWSVSRDGCSLRQCRHALCAEALQRDLSTFEVHDLTMSMQALARFGASGIAPLCHLTNEAHRRQLASFTTTDKALTLWSLAKSRVCHLALCRLLVQSLAQHKALATSVTLDVANAILWSLAVLWHVLCEDAVSANQLLHIVVKMKPWENALPVEVANVAWAFSKLHSSLCLADGDCFASLLSAFESITPGGTTLHDLCNLLIGLLVIWCPPSEASVSSRVHLLMKSFADDFVALVNIGEKFSSHDRRKLDAALKKAHSRHSHSGVPVDIIASLESMVASVPAGRHRRVDVEVDRENVPPDAGTWGQPKQPFDESEGDGMVCKVSKSSTISRQLHACSSSSKCAQPQPPPTAECVALRVLNDDHLSIGICNSSHVVSRNGIANADTEDDLQDTSMHGRRFCSKQCCPPMFASPADEEIKLNTHCVYKGHCIQMKNTFVHIECEVSDSDDDCMLCVHTRKGRSRSADNLEFQSSRSPAHLTTSASSSQASSSTAIAITKVDRPVPTVSRKMQYPAGGERRTPMLEPAMSSTLPDPPLPPGANQNSFGVSRSTASSHRLRTAGRVASSDEATVEVPMYGKRFLTQECCPAKDQHLITGAPPIPSPPSLVADVASKVIEVREQHRQAHVISDEVPQAMNASLHGKELCSDECCPSVLASTDDEEIKLNTHCVYKGHCIQMKNTFVHVECEVSDSEDDCMVCARTRGRRSRSCDNLEFKSSRPPPSPLILPVPPPPPPPWSGRLPEVRH